MKEPAPRKRPSTESGGPDIPIGSYWLRLFGGGRVSPMYKLDWEPKGLLRTYSGRVSWAEVNESISEVHSAPRYEDLSYVINDFSECESLEITRDQIEDIAARVSGAEYAHKPQKILRHFKTAYVATSPSMRNTVTTFISATIVNTSVNIFGTVLEARAWVTQGK
ncbi:MAG: hypothetical protein IPH08_04540 [Rhodocyclaceae bacterium]|nr:hypothetical protein [Rhodocyclaceae bacterium]